MQNKIFEINTVLFGKSQKIGFKLCFQNIRLNYKYYKSYATTRSSLICGRSLHIPSNEMLPFICQSVLYLNQV